MLLESGSRRPTARPGFALRWSFYEIADVSVGVSLAMITVFLAICLAIVTWMFRTGYRLKT